MNADIPVIQILSSNATVGALIGGTGIGTARVFPGDVPQNEVYPLLMVEVYDSQPFDTKDGESVVDHETVKVFCYAETTATAASLASAVREVLDNFSGTVGSYTLGHIRYLRQDSQRVQLTNRKAFLRELDFMVRINN